MPTREQGQTTGSSSAAAASASSQPAAPKEIRPAEKVYPQYVIVDGIRYMNGYIEENVRSALNYKPLDGDIFIVTYPKCGTTWTQQIVYLILNDGQPPESAVHLFREMPYIEMVGADCVTAAPERPKAIKTHLPFQITPWSDQAKYIYVVRNPKDCLVSFYHHSRYWPGYRFFDGAFEVFYELFMKGEVDYNDYFEHVKGWWEQRHRKNVLFVTYEDTKNDPKTSILNIAKFLGDTYHERLINNPLILSNCVKYSDVFYMKSMNSSVDLMFTQRVEDVKNNPYLPEGMKKVMINITSIMEEYEEEKKERAQLERQRSGTGKGFIRKGVVNDWKNYLSPEQSERLNQKFWEHAKEWGIDKIWSNLDWLK